MRVTIHRGSHEIGGSCVEIEHEDSRILLDVGMPLFCKDGSPLDGFAVGRRTSEELSEIGILPGIPRVFGNDRAGEPGVLAVFLSHAHADHYGLCEWLRDDVTVYLGEGTRILINSGRLMSGKAPIGTRCRLFEHGVPVEVGPFRVTPILVDHSVFDAFAFVIEAGGKSVIYTGDFRDHGRKKGMLARLMRTAPKAADALLIEGTLAGSKETGRSKLESTVEEEIVSTIKSSPGYVFVSTSSQNIDRIVSLYRAAIRTGRLLVLDVYSANILNDLKDRATLPHPSKDYPLIRVYFPRRIATRYAEMGEHDRLYRFRPFKITRDQMAEQPEKILMMLKPSMIRDAELMEGVEGSTLVWSQWSGYLKQKSTEKLLNLVETKRLRLVQHHTGGHADPETLAKVIRRLRPKMVVPMHTFHPEAFRGLDDNVVLPTDGEPLEI